MSELPLLPLPVGVAGVKRTRSHPELDYEQALIDYHAISSSLDVSERPRFWLNVGLLLLVGACWLVSAILMLRAKKVGREITPEQDALLDEYWANLWRAFGLATVTWLFVQDPIKVFLHPRPRPRQVRAALPPHADLAAARGALII